MTSHRGLDGFPTDQYDMLPSEIKSAFTAWGRASAAVRVYRRRGWNDSAAVHHRDRRRAELLALLDRNEHAEQNPSLF